MEVDTRRKVTAKVTSYNGTPSSSNIRTTGIRPPSPVKRGVSPAPSPVMRPKAKINSSATPQSLTRKPSKITSSLSAASTPRAGSPAVFKPSPRINPNVQSSKPRLLTATNRPTSSTPGTPVHSPYSALSRAAPMLSFPTSNPPSPHRRTSSASFVRNGANSPQPPSAMLPSPASDSFTDNDRVDTPPRIKSKVSSMARQVDTLSPTPSSMSRARAPSISSSVSMGSQASTSVVDASTPRYDSFRAKRSPPPHHSYQPFPRDEGFAKPKSPPSRIDPVLIPLPPHSPPMSSVSMSSRSSVSRSSRAESTDSGNGNPRSANGNSIRNALETLLQFSSGTEDESSDGSGSERKDDDKTRERRVKAKTNRQMEDLEISNRSLLAINATLEATKHRQAKEIRELRRKLRESRLILPPSTYRTIKSRDPKDEDTDEGEDEEGEEDDDPNDESPMSKGDQTYQRVKVLLDNLIQDGQRALESKPADFLVADAQYGGKVLSAAELRDLEGDGDISIRTEVSIVDEEDEEGLESEDEVAEMTLLPDSESPSPRLLSPNYIATPPPSRKSPPNGRQW
ncbi:hypothetical protein CYLTODRAFT_485343 [Cylindrobasidium torrendii FP15055 ss-10]|uniref:Uncharacterized protein n=1 Tax=Cylindrobasidium torrendii FP15055 ss-10 TaxID=1314674 RepID=A0A0D7BSV1_9AGAR|nr:hypothetical protein CYLTODRAFT_485343 [Cylindrobasidium torrendii FP15055 ss-10]